VHVFAWTKLKVARSAALGAIGIGGAGLLLQIDRPTLAQTAAPTTAQTIHVDAPPSTGAFKGR